MYIYYQVQLAILAVDASSVVSTLSKVFDTNAPIVLISISVRLVSLL